MTTTKNSTSIKRMVIAALMLALAYILPNFTGNIPQIGNMLLPMHLPTILCGYLCGGPWGAAVGFIAPLMRSAILGMPPPFPTAVSMAVEMAVYGFVSGFLSRRLPKTLGGIYASLISAMLIGRVVWGVVQLTLLTSSGTEFPFSAFVAGAFTNAIPGIILQLVAIPIIVLALQRANLIPQEG